MEAPSNPPANRQRKSGIVIPHQPNVAGQIAAASAYGALRTFAATWRCTVNDPHRIFSGTFTEPIIFALWHNRLALSMKIWTDMVRPRSRDLGLAALISASKDGAILAKTLSYFGVQAVRGSSSRRGAQALLELTRHIEKGYHAAITPDGPRGPKYRVQDGAISVAQITGRPIVPVSWSASGYWETKSWDRFRIPKPFARVNILLGEPLAVPEGVERESYREELQRRLIILGQDEPA